MEKIATIKSDFSEKFGIPRQSGLVNELKSQIIFEKKFRDINAVRGLEEFSHIWIIWQFSESKSESFSPTVRPPRLGGNERRGVFATRSPFRPNSIAISSVMLERIDYDNELAPILHIRGADLLDGTPILDIKPYISYTDSHPMAKCGFADEKETYRLNVVIPPELLPNIRQGYLPALIKILESDPRPSYQEDEKRIYGFVFAEMEIKFTVKGDTLTVTSILKK